MIKVGLLTGWTWPWTTPLVSGCAGTTAIWIINIEVGRGCSKQSLGETFEGNSNKASTMAATPLDDAEDACGLATKMRRAERGGSTTSVIRGNGRSGSSKKHSRSEKLVQPKGSRNCSIGVSALFLCHQVDHINKSKHTDNRPLDFIYSILLNFLAIYGAKRIATTTFVQLVLLLQFSS